MENILGFTTINIYALVLILFVCGVFFSKKRLHDTEDNSYAYLLVATILTILFGIVLGLIVVSEYNVSEIVISLSNKFYLYV